MKKTFYLFAFSLLFFLPFSPAECQESAKKPDALRKPLAPYGGFIMKMEKGARIWTDREDVFLEVPGVLEGKGYICSPMQYSEALVEKEGYVYVITPSPEEDPVRGRFSRSAAGKVIPYFAPNLIEKDFERMTDIPGFKISSKLKETVEVYRKYAQKGEIIKYGRPSWGVTAAELPDGYKPVEAAKLVVEEVFNRPAGINLQPGEEYAFKRRTYQGVPGIEITPGGRLWASWVACNCGVYTEGPRNYAVLVTSADGGKTWSDPPVLVAQHPVWSIGCIDPMVWHDPVGRFWYVWTNRDVALDIHNSWGITTENSENGNPAWTDPKKIGEGTLMNKPTVLSTGEWLFCSSNRGSPVDVYISTDKGRTISHFSEAEVPGAGWNEHMIIERKDGSLWMLVRTNKGIGQTFSYDKGRTWTKGELYRAGPSTRFHIRRLRSGRLLLITHPVPDPMAEKTIMRTNLTAYLSEDEGKTWPCGLLLDGREWVSYPDASEAKDGIIYSVHDHHRPSKMEIVLSVFTEEDIMAGNLVNKNSRLGVIISGRDKK